jgi:hypothetical protein
MNIHIRCPGRGLLVLMATLFSVGAAFAADFDPTPVGKPIREELPNGYKEIYKNKNGERVQEDTFDPLGQKKSSKHVVDRHPNGKDKKVETTHYEQKAGQTVEARVETYEYDNKGVTTAHKEETIDRDANGNIKKRTTTTFDPVTGEPTEREITDAATGKKTHKVWDPAAKKWKTVKPEKKEDGTRERGDSSFEPAPDSTVYFHAGELQFRAFAVLAVGNAQKTVTHKVKETKTVTRDVTVEETELVDDPEVGAFVPVTKEIVVPTEFRETTEREEKETIGPYSDNAFGFGMDLKFFPCNHIGIGFEGDWLSAEHDAWTVLGTLTARYPIEGNLHIAPYLAAGLGGQFADTDRLVGMVAVGVEKRFSPVCGTFVEGRYLFDGDQQNVFELRAGVSFAFGPGKETTGQTVIPGGTHSEAWGSINPLAKPLRY